MDTLAFLKRVLPATGLYVAARLAGKGFRNQICTSIEEVAQRVLDYDAQGVDAYMALAAYREESVEGVKDGKPIRQVRVHKNVRSLRSWWIDLDVGAEAHKYPSQELALESFVSFIQTVGLPMPLVVSSGYGVHIYWTANEELLPEVWKQTAEGLKALAVKHSLKTDPACTSDMARVLRPVGTYNRKNANAPKLVELIADAEPIDGVSFGAAIVAELKRAGITAPKETIRKVESATEGINQAFAVQTSFPPCSGARVAERCAQVRTIRDTRGNIPEPHWYAGIQLLTHAIEGDELIHEWSKGYAGYSEDETAKKIAQVRGQSLGPTLCSTFEARNPSGCDNCPFRGKISSPAQLGTAIPSAPAPVVSVASTDAAGARVQIEVTLPAPPLPFTRGEQGGIYIEEEGITHKIYEYDFFPTEIAYDEQLGYETTRFRHCLPEEGWKEFLLQSSLLARPVDFEAKLRDNHVRPLIRNKMAQYADAYLRKLATQNKMRKLFKAQGWKEDDTEFVLGDKLYTKTGVQQAGFSQGTERFLAPFHARGSLEVWRTLTSVFQHPGFEPHAFMLLIAFATPLLKLAGRQGFTVNALGDSGAGKSTMAKFMSSVYGHPEGAWVTREDTALARMQRLGAHYSLPIYMDEATTIPNKELRDLVYSIPTGKSRASMTRDYKLREGAEWATIFVTTANDSLQSKLQMEKQNAEAESLRLFEFRFPKVAAFAPIAKMIPGVIADNYGVAGAEFVRQLVLNREAVKARLATVVEEAETAFGMESKERFWSQAIALTLYGGELARQWGVIDFDPATIKPWLKAETGRMRGHLAESVASSVTILGQYLNEHVGGRLTISALNAGMNVAWTKPGHEITQRYEKDNNTLYVPRSHIKSWMDKKFFSYNDTKDDLYSRGILLNPGARKILGAGTDYTGAQVPCWKIRMNHPDLAPIVGEGE